MATWYVDTTASGANDGTSAIDAWANLEDAIKYASFADGDVLNVMENQTSTVTGAIAFADSGSLGAPIRMVLCDSSWNEIPSSGVKHILDLAGNDLGLNNKGGWIIEGMKIIQTGAGSNLLSGNGSFRWEYCDLENQVAGSYKDGLDGGGTHTFINCNIKADYRVFQFGRLTCYMKDCTIGHYNAYNGNGYGIYPGGATSQGRFFLENVTFGTGGNVFNTDISCNGGPSLRVVGRNVSLSGTTEVGGTPYAAGMAHDDNGVWIEDYNGTKGAWYHKLMDGRVTAIDLLATSTGKGAKKYTDKVIKAICSAGVSAKIPALIAEFPVYIGSTGSKTVTCWTQPEGWASLPNTQGSDADLWVEVAAWDTGNSEYLYFDSRDKATQTTQVNSDWKDIIVENVAVDATGWIIVRVYQARGDGADIIDVDMAPQVT